MSTSPGFIAATGDGSGMTDLVTFGESMLRFGPPGDERLETADAYEVHVAGAESNVATAAQRLGLDATWASKLPDSPVARKVTGTLANHGVDLEVTWSEDGRLGTYYLETADQPRGNEIVYDRANAAVTTTTPADLPLDRVREAAGFHTSGITPALSDQLRETTERVLQAAARAETTVSFDVNYRSKLWSPAEARRTITGLLSTVDVLVVAERDARHVLDVEGDAEAIARSLDREFGFEVVLVTRGAEGALALEDGESYAQPTFDSTDAHPVGTGDAFVGGFLSQYLLDEPLANSLEYGAATAALKRTIPGDLAVVSPEEIEGIIRGEGSEISR
jgi:2-dehydro-3-deoxygluconokinase